MTINQFAKQYGLRVTKDECGDPIIQSNMLHYPHLYFDGAELCLTGLDTTVEPKILASLGGRLWTGDRWTDDRGRVRRDAKIQGIPQANWGLAAGLLKGTPQTATGLPCPMAA